MRLIDADKLEPHEIYDDNGFAEVVYMDDIREMPTVEADVVRCKDCKYWHDDMTWDDDMTLDDVENEETGYYCEYHETVYWRADDFCSKGEGRDDNEDKH